MNEHDRRAYSIDGPEKSRAQSWRLPPTRGRRPEGDHGADARVFLCGDERERTAEGVAHDRNALRIDIRPRAQEREARQHFIELLMLEQIELHATPSCHTIVGHCARHQVTVGRALSAREANALA